MMTILNNFLSELPFNGAKTYIGVILSVFAYFYPDLPREELSNLLIEIIGSIGNVLLALGLIHKYVKAKKK